MSKNYYRRSYYRKKENALSVLLMLVVLIVIGLFFVYFSINSNTETENIEVGSSSNKLIETINFLDDEVFHISVKDQVNTNVVGEYPVEYSFLGKKFHKVYNVVDNKPPVINLSGDIMMTLDDISQFVEPGYEAVDSYDGDVTSKVTSELVQYEENHYYMEYFVADSSGNQGGAIRYIDIAKGCVFLTFDDGPSQNITPQILKTLADNDVKATFFVVGYDEENSKLVQEEMNAGHTIGLHGYSHNYSEIYTSLDVLMNNFDKLRDMVYDTTNGYTAKFIRFPGGSSNTVSKNYCNGIMTAAAKEVTSRGYTYFDWNVDSCDAGGADSSDEIYNNVVAGVQPGRTNIVLMHDSSTHQDTADALQRIIDYCKTNGYELKAINNSTKAIQHSISN